MTDERLNTLKNIVSDPESNYGQIRITKIKISDYRFFCGEYEFDFNGKNVLMYGENGSGKSSVYKALGLLASKKYSEITEHVNIFSEGKSPLVEFSFSNGRDLIIHSDLDELPKGMEFIEGLSVFSPMLDYKKLLKVHFSMNEKDENINIYDMLRILFKDYPCKEKQTLSEITDPIEYFDTLKSIVNSELIVNSNEILNFFEADVKILSFGFQQKFASDGRGVEPVINIKVEFKDNELTSYHNFLNEARLTSLAISIYFSAILRLLDTLNKECLKILVLDDLLISLDMSNRLKLLEILKNKFNNFQIFFFTHDKESFDLFRDKMDWEKFELYLHEIDNIPKPIIKKGASEIDRAKEFFAQKEYEACALFLRKGFEKLLKNYLPRREQLDKNFNELDLSGLIGKAIFICSFDDTLQILKSLNSNRKHLLNQLCHSNPKTIHANEIKEAIENLEKLNELLK